MGKRLIRIYDKDIPAKSMALTGMKINLVLHNNSTFHGLLIKVTEEGLELKDMLNRKHTFKFSQMTEIVYDIVASY
jgi:hypothetical protein